MSNLFLTLLGKLLTELMDHFLKKLQNLTKNSS